uniref:Uncharacterized protein n=1 Tax=Lepeophtheirus salmonis TaxID=72036 RepID=A0A0K2TME6_LEPSM
MDKFLSFGSNRLKSYGKLDISRFPTLEERFKVDGVLDSTVLY